MSDFLTPDTNIALMQASQQDTGSLREKLRFAGSSANGKSQSEKIAEAAQEFEAVFLSEMMKPMFEGIETAAPFGGGKGEEIFQSFLVQEYGKIMAQTGKIGIADHVQQELINLQEQADNETISSK